MYNIAFVLFVNSVLHNICILYKLYYFILYIMAFMEFIHKTYVHFKISLCRRNICILHFIIIPYRYTIIVIEYNHNIIRDIFDFCLILC